jgi:hypothetical protein
MGWLKEQGVKKMKYGIVETKLTRFSIPVPHYTTELQLVYTSPAESLKD